MCLTIEQNALCSDQTHTKTLIKGINLNKEQQKHHLRIISSKNCQGAKIFWPILILDYIYTLSIYVIRKN